MSDKESKNAPALLGRVEIRPLEEEMKSSYINYAMSVIVGRALPDVRDGLKPVHRRILYAMEEMGLAHNKPFKKSARVVGDCLGKYHPHGDLAVYESLVRMAQDFSLRHTLVEGQGNFGSVDGDPPAAMRYCVTGDTLVITDKGLQRVDALSPTGREDVSIRVLSKDGAANTASKWFDCGVFPVWRVATRSGYDVAGTSNHPLLACGLNFEGKPELQWKTIGEILPGDFLVLNRDNAFWPSNEVDVRVYHPKLDNPRVKRHDLPTRLSEDLALILGALIAEGTFRKNVIEFTNIPGEYAQAFQDAWRRVFPTCRLHVFKRDPVSYGKKPFLQMQIVSQQVVAFLFGLGMTGKSGDRLISQAVFQSPRKVVAAFLRGLYEGDGSVEISGRSLLRVGLWSKGNKLVRQVQTILLRFGIASALRRDFRSGHFRLCITGRKNLERFSGSIGLVSSRKKSALARALNLNTGRALSKTDFIPFLSDFVRRQALRGHREWLAKHNFDRSERLTAVLPRLGQALLRQDRLVVDEITRGDYLFDEVLSVDYAGERKVYSVRVDSPCHSFVANGFINHNTEVRLARVAGEMINDIDKETVDFTANYDGSLMEPKVLPSKLPNLLINGSSGIAVGMATNILPHNLNEACDAIGAYIDNPEITIDELMESMKGPDFPTGGIIQGRTGIKDYFSTGRGSVVVRAKADIEEIRSGRMAVVVTEIPYQVNKSTMLETIANLARDKKIPDISDIRDESDREGMRVVIEIKREGNPHVALNQLFAHSQMESSFGVIMLALVGGEPKVLNLKEMIVCYVDHRKEIVTRRARFELTQAENRAHIVEGLRIAIEAINRVIKIIREAKDTENAKKALMEELGLSAKQAQAILDMRLAQLTALERVKLEAEYKELIKTIERLKGILASPKKVLDIIKSELEEIKKTYANPRKTEITDVVEEAKIEDLIKKEEVVVTMSHLGYIKRMPVDVYRAQARGGKGVTAADTKGDEDFIEEVMVTDTHASMLFFTNRGRVYQSRVFEIPEFSRVSRGKPIVQFIGIAANREEKVTGIITIRSFGDKTSGCLVMATRRGVVKRCETKFFEHIRKTGVTAINLREGDVLVGVHSTEGDAEVILATKHGKSIRFPETNVRSMGRTAYGVRGISLEKDDEVIGLETADPKEKRSLLTVCENGFGKRTELDEYRGQRRGGSGVITIKATERNGSVVGIKLISDEHDLMILTEKGMGIRLHAKDIRVISRNTQGVRLVKLEPGDKIACVEPIAHNYNHN